MALGGDSPLGGELNMKIGKVPPHLRATFMRAVERVYQREAEMMLQFLSESRQEMSLTALEMQEEQSSLRTRFRVLEDKRRKADKEAVDRYIRERHQRSKSTSRVGKTDIQNKDAVLAYLNKRNGRLRRESRAGQDPADQQPSDRNDMDSRAGTSFSMRSLPTPLVTKTFEDLRDELLNELNCHDSHVESERQRQAELLEFLREAKKQKQQAKYDHAQELLQEAENAEKHRVQDKERQQQKVRDQLEEKKKQAGHEVGHHKPMSRRKSRRDIYDQYDEIHEEESQKANTRQDRPMSRRKSRASLHDEVNDESNGVPRVVSMKSGLRKDRPMSRRKSRSHMHHSDNQDNEEVQCERDGKARPMSARGATRPQSAVHK